MLKSSDFRELLNLFKKHEIRYLVVGGYAVMKYSERKAARQNRYREAHRSRTIGFT